MGGAVVKLPSRPLLRWYGRRWRRALGWPGFAGLLLLFLAAAFHLAATLPAERRSRELQAQLAEARQRAAAPAPREIASPAARLLAFYEQFPRRDSLAAWMEQIYAAGRHAALVLERAEYKLAAERGSPLLRYEIGLPLHGSYPQVRLFIREVLEKAPTLALRDIEIGRAAIGESRLDVRLRLVLYLRENL